MIKKAFTQTPPKITFILFGVTIVLFFLFWEFLGGHILQFIFDSIRIVTGYVFGININVFDVLIFSSIPLLGMLLHSKQAIFNALGLLKAILLILVSTILTFLVGLLIIFLLGKPTNPLIPFYYREEPFWLYSTLTFIIAVSIPFKLRFKNVSPIEEVVD